jgi:pimeloyl-ACP methyl ester carboxylesterase
MLAGRLATPADHRVGSAGSGPGPVQTAWLVTDDGVRISVAHWLPAAPASDDSVLSTVFVLGHGFTGSWESPGLRRAAWWFSQHGGVVALSWRGHGRSGGRSTVGNREVLDLDQAVRWARHLGYERVVTVGFSMGGSVVVRHAGLLGGVDAAVSVSAPSRWRYRGTPRMRVVHWIIAERAGRAGLRLARGTRVASGWGAEPAEPRAAAAGMDSTRLLVVHGDLDEYFPLDHAQQIVEGAGSAGELWVEPGFGHAENALPEELAHRIARWALQATRQSPQGS